MDAGLLLPFGQLSNEIGFDEHVHRVRANLEPEAYMSPANRWQYSPKSFREESAQVAWPNTIPKAIYVLCYTGFGHNEQGVQQTWC